MSVPPLPPELLIRIFDLATFVPHSLDVEVANPFDYPLPLDSHNATSVLYLREQILAVRPSLITKSALSRVCWDWHRLLLPSLYEIISFTREDSMLRFFESTRGSRASVQPQLSGRYTRRLDIAFPHNSFFKATESEPSLEHFIRSLAHLEISVIHSDSSFSAHFVDIKPTLPLGIIRALRTSCSNTLRKLSWNIGFRVKDPMDALELEDFFKLVENAPNLRTIAFSPVYHREGFISLNPLHPSCRNRSFLSPIVYPNADSASWVILAHPMFSSSAIRPRHYSSAFSPSVVYTFDWPQFPGPQNLRHLSPDIHHYIFLISRDNVRLPPLIAGSITHLGLQKREHDEIDDYMYTGLILYIESLRESAPNLRVVRFLNSEFVQDLLQWHVTEFRRLLWRIEGWQFHVEDHLCRTLVASHSAQSGDTYVV